MSPIIIRKTVLAELAGAPPEGITQGALLTIVQTRLPSVRMADLADELAWVRDHSLAAFTPNPLDEDNRELRAWAITSGGRLTLKAS